MRRRTLLTLATTVVALGLVAAPARAGGGPNGLDFEGPHEIAGEVAESGPSHVWFGTAADARAALTGIHYVYLERGFRYRDNWRPPGKGAVAAGRISVTPIPWADNILRARARFVVPDLRNGLYSAYACDVGCDEPLGDVFPVPVRVFRSALEARIAFRLDRTREGLQARIRRLDS